MLFAPPHGASRRALVGLRARLRRALRLFHKITGLTAVATLSPSFPESRTAGTLSPPIHPQCARRLQSVLRAPCGEQWLSHLKSSRRSARPHSHACPIGMRCSCVPIHVDDRLVGVAKLVARPGTSDAAFESAIGVLRLSVSEASHDSLVSVISEEVQALRQRVADFERTRRRRSDGAAGPNRPSTSGAASRSDALVDHALAYLQDHYLEPTVSLRTVARTLGCNPKYLTTRFTERVGQHMRHHLTALRIAHACRLLIETDLRVKEIANASGFTGTGQMDEAFRRDIGVSPVRYRRIFAAP